MWPMSDVELQKYMLNKPITVKPEMTLFRAAHQILRYKVSGVCVIDDDNNLVGILSELDCLRAIVNSDEEAEMVLVADVMTTEIECSHPHDDIIRVASSMLEKKHRRLPVSVDGKLAGQITCRQILKAIKDFAAPTDPSEKTQ